MEQGRGHNGGEEVEEETVPWVLHLGRGVWGVCWDAQPHAPAGLCIPCMALLHPGHSLRYSRLSPVLSGGGCGKD